MCELVFEFAADLITFKMGGKDYLGKDMRRSGKADDKEEEKEFKALDEGDITLLKTYGQGQYSKPLKEVILIHFLKRKKSVLLYVKNYNV